MNMMNVMNIASLNAHLDSFGLLHMDHGCICTCSRVCTDVEIQIETMQCFIQDTYRNTCTLRLVPTLLSHAWTYVTV